MSFAFLGTDNGNDRPLTIIAHDMEHAARIYGQWMKQNQGRVIKGAIDLRTLPDEYIYAQPEMRDLIDSGYTGVCYWVEASQVWTAGHLGPAKEWATVRPIKVQGFAFLDDEGAEVWVFGKDLAEAHAIYDVWHRGEWGSPAEWESIRHVRPSDFIGGKLTLRADMEAGVTGIAAQTDDGVWRICSPEHD